MKRKLEKKNEQKEINTNAKRNGKYKRSNSESEKKIRKKKEK